MSADEKSSERVTTKEFYSALLLTQDQLVNVERRILDKLEPLSAMLMRVDTHSKEIDKLREDVESLQTRSTWWDGLNSLGAVGAFIAGILSK